MTNSNEKMSTSTYLLTLGKTGTGEKPQNCDPAVSVGKSVYHSITQQDKWDLHQKLEHDCISVELHRAFSA